MLPTPDKRQIEVRTTVLIGAHDNLYRPGPKAARERAGSLMPNVRTHLIERSGHVVHVDAPDAVVAHMLEGLA